MLMQDGSDARIKSELIAEITALEEHYQTIKKYLLGAEYDPAEIVGTLQVFKTGLDRVSVHILTFYTLKGHRTKITWESLINNLATAIETLHGFRSSNPKSAIQAAFNMSDPNVGEVMSYLATLKKSLV
jgi:hypothetical protein